MPRHRCIAMSLALGGLLYLGGCDNSFAPDVYLRSSEEVNAERVRVVKELYQAVLEKEQNTPLKLRTGNFKVMGDSSDVPEAIDDSVIVAVLAEMVRQYPPDWKNAETWDTGDGGYFLATLLGQNVIDISPTDPKVSVIRVLVADVNLDGKVVPGSMHLVEFAGRDLDITQFKSYVNQWLKGDFGDTPILVAEYTVGYASAGAFFYQPGKEPTRVTMALRRSTVEGKAPPTYDTICYTVVEWEEQCLVAEDPPMGETCEWIAYLGTTCVTTPTEGEGGGGGDRCNSESGGCGGGSGSGGNNGDSGGEGEEELEITLSCPKNVMRGDEANCQIVSEGDSEDLEEFTFTWSSNWGASHTGLSWGGIATDDVTISVSTTDWNSEAKITILDRSWDTPPSLNPDPKYVQLSSGLGGLFRLFAIDPESGAGTGPWNGRHYVRSAPIFRAELHISKNYDTRWHQRLSLPRYSFSYGDLSPIARAACPEVQSISRGVSYRYLNDECGTLSVWTNMHEQIRRHEQEHQAGHNSCLRSTTTFNFFSDLEQLTGSKSVIDTELTSGSGMWEVYLEKLDRAGSYASPTRSIAPFFYHTGNWIYDMRIGGVHPYLLSGC